ncbi:MAG: hypothetical protein AB1774_05900 [Bacillota bacterium]
MQGPKDEVLRAGAVVRGSLADAYGYLGTVVLLSLAWFAWLACAAFVLSFFIRSFVAMVPVVLVVAAPPAGAAFHVTGLILNGRDAVARDFVIGLRKFFLRSLGVMAAHVGVLGVVVVDIVWFLTRPGMAVKVIGGLWLYALLFLAMMTPYYFPIMVQQDAGLRKILKRAALLVLANPLYSLVILVFEVAITALCVFLAPAFSLLYMGVIAFAGNRATRMLFEKYGVLSDNEEHDGAGPAECVDVHSME